MAMEFPINRTVVGTLMAVGLTPSTRPDITRMLGFATFELNGKLESYHIPSEADFDYLLYHLSSKGKRITTGSMERQDLQVQLRSSQEAGAPSLLLYEKLGGNWTAIVSPWAMRQLQDAVEPARTQATNQPGYFAQSPINMDAVGGPSIFP